MSQPQILDTRFRSALARLAQSDRILTYEKPADPHLEIAAILKKHDGRQALLFPSVITVVDHDIDIRDLIDVEYAVATRMEASADLILIPGARGHEYVRVSKEGVRTKHGRRPESNIAGGVQKLHRGRHQEVGRSCDKYPAVIAATFEFAVVTAS